MFLIKCKCGCFFTTKEPSDRGRFRCQNCGMLIELGVYSSYAESKQELDNAGVSVSYVPYNAKVTVTFDA